MDAELAKELREAADQLLDIASPAPSSAFPTSPHLQQSRRQQPSPSKAAAVATPTPSTFSSTSRIEVLHSPTDVRPWQWPAAPSTASGTGPYGNGGPSVAAAQPSHQPIKIELGSMLLDDADDHLPARGLSSRVQSVKAATAHEPDEPHSPASAHPTDEFDQELRASSPNRIRVHTPINDIYINQYGERVVQGRVVGRTIGGRPRPVSRDRDSLHPANNSLIERSTSPGPSSTQQISPISSSEPASASTSTPPAFFLESFPDAFQRPPSTSTTKSPPSAKKKERRPSRGGPPSIIKAPRAVAGALTLAHSDNVDDPPSLPDTSFQTASDFGSPSSSSSKQLSISPRPSKIRLSSNFSTRHIDEEVATRVGALQLNTSERAKSPWDKEGLGLLSPSDGVLSPDSARSKIELPFFRRPTPTIELSQAKAEPVVLHGNRRQARASGVSQPQSEASSNNGGSTYASPVVSPSTTSTPLPPIEGERQSPEAAVERDPTETRSRLESVSEPSSPLLSPRRSRVAQGHVDEETQRTDGDGNDDDVDNASLESAPSSLISLPVSTLTSSSRSPSHHSLERRRSGGSTFSHRRRPSSTSIRHSDVFAREVRIRGWSEVGSQARGWVVFELRIITKQGTPIIAHKRFSSFVKLRTALLSECKDQAKWLPQLETRRTGLLSKYDAKYLEKRRKALQRWLEVVALDRVWGASEALREWVLASD